MKLIFDQNLSFKLRGQLEDIFPGSEQLHLLGMDTAVDEVIWDYAAENEFTIVTQDVDYANRSILLGHPPKIIWLRCGSQPTNVVERILRTRAVEITAFHQNATRSILEFFQ